ncbi:MAG: hypothetical protein ACXW1T_03535 [Methylophilus sp.]
MNVNKRLKFTNILYWSIFTFSIFFLTGCDDKIKDQNAYMLQCVNHPAPNSQSRQFDTIISTGKVNCHALLWRIPKQYLPDVKGSVDMSDHNDIISKRVVINKAPASILPVWSGKASSEDDVNEIEFEAVYHPLNQTLLAQWLYLTISAYDLKKVDESFNGWEVYSNAESEKREHIPTWVVFKKTKPVEYMLECQARDVKSYKNIPANKPCLVRTVIDSRVTAEYRVNFAQINQMDEINNNVIRFATSLMLN